MKLTDIEQRVYDHTIKTIELAGDKFKVDLRSIEVKFNGRLSRCLGRCVSEYDRRTGVSTPVRIEFSRGFIVDNPTKVLDLKVVEHEVAHAVVMAKYGRDVKPHGTEWCNIAYSLGGELATTIKQNPRDLNLENSLHRNKIQVGCDCTTHMVTSRVYNQINTGISSWSCKLCKSSLRCI